MDLITKYNNYQLALRERKETETIEKSFRYILIIFIQLRYTTNALKNL